MGPLQVRRQDVRVAGVQDGGGEAVRRLHQPRGRGRHVRPPGPVRGVGGGEQLQDLSPPQRPARLRGPVGHRHQGRRGRPEDHRDRVAQLHQDRVVTVRLQVRAAPGRQQRDQEGHLRRAGQRGEQPAGPQPEAAVEEQHRAELGRQPVLGEAEVLPARPADGPAPGASLLPLLHLRPTSASVQQKFTRTDQCRAPHVRN